MCVPPMEKPTCAAFKEYEEVPETVPLNFTEDDVTWAAPQKVRNCCCRESMETSRITMTGCTWWR